MASSSFFGRKRATAHLLKVILMLRQRRVAAGTVWATAWASDKLYGRKRVSTHLPRGLLLLRQCRVATGNGLGIGLSTTITNVNICS